MTHSHWPLITRKSHKQPKKLQKLRVLNEYNAFQMGLRHLEFIFVGILDLSNESNNNFLKIDILGLKN